MDVVILNYNSSNDTLKLLNNLVEIPNSINHIVIVDNKSNNNERIHLDREVSLLKSKIHSPKISILLNEENKGYAYGNNVGLKYLENDDTKDGLVAIMNPDIFIEKDQLEGLVYNYSLAEERHGENSIGIISPWVINSGETGLVAWKMPNFVSDLIAASSILKKIIGNKLQYKNLDRNSGIKVVDVLPGSFLLINKSALKEVGYLDDSTFLYCEERILSSKMQRHGYINILDTNHYYYHEHSKTINKFLGAIKKINFLYDGKKIYYIKEKKSPLQGNVISSLRVLTKLEYISISFLKFLINKMKG